jgi:SAM-dependent methyltransferase
MTPGPQHLHPPVGVKHVGEGEVHLFRIGECHRDEATIAAFGEEWGKFNVFDAREIELVGKEYFDIVPDDLLRPDTMALDMGCGSGRWTRYLSSRVGHVEAIDPSEAVFHAAERHGDLANVRWNQADVDNIPFADGTFDLVVCLGVLHHVPDTAGAVSKLVAKLKPGGHLLLYLYYALDGRGPLYRALFKASDGLRRMVCVMPGPIKRMVCDLIAYVVYLPLRTVVRAAKASDAGNWRRLPLSYYHDKSMLVLRNDALDRFGTPLEQRFTKARMEVMMRNAGLRGIIFSAQAPYWHAIGQRPPGQG